MFEPNLKQKVAGGVFLLVMFAAIPICGQQAQMPASAKAEEKLPPLLEFDVVSVKEFKLVGDTLNMLWRWDPGGLTAINQPLRQLICLAWGVKSHQVSGGPEWLDTAYFQIQAKMDDVAIEKMNLFTPKERAAMQKRMLQAILTDRFKLTLRHEMKPFPGYALVVAKGGAKLREAAATDEDSSGAKGSDGAPLGAGRIMTSLDFRGIAQLTAQALPVEDLIAQLTSMVSGQVRNETGLKGVYDIKLRYSQDRGLSAEPGAGGNAPDAPPNLFNALQEQLGLKLEPHKVMDEALIVEHAEKPTEN